METTIETPVARTKRRYNPDLIKPIHARITDSPFYKEAFGDRPLTEAELEEISEIDKQGLYTNDRRETFVKFIKYGLSGWAARWLDLKTYKIGSLNYHVTMYGVMHGTIIYLDANSRKTAHFDHSSETQRRKSLISADKTRGRDDVSQRNVKYWTKKGYTEAEAKELVRQVQATNTLETYQKKYGEELGAIKFKERNENWSTHMESIPGINKKRSPTLESYIAKHGIEEGTRLYNDMRANRKRKNTNSSSASAESLVALSDIINLLDKYEITYYIGVEGNQEWAIFDEDEMRWFYYDLTIPSLAIIIEYHGECFHPNPIWDQEKWDNWSQVFDGRTADAKYQFDMYKKEIAEMQGWYVYEMYSSSVQETRRVILEDFAKLGYVL
jgi:hypothetical protein